MKKSEKILQREKKHAATRVAMLMLLSDVIQTILYDLKDRMKQDYKQEIELSLRRMQKLINKFNPLIHDMSKDSKTGKIDRDKEDKVKADFDEDSALLLDFMFAAAEAERQGRSQELRSDVKKYLNNET